jgi:hypothetical protein
MKRIKELSDLLRTSATEYRDNGLKSFQDDKEMCEVYRSDYDDLLKIARIIDEGKIGEAFEEMDKLDTVVRDMIPDNVWNTCKMFYEINT